MFKEFKEFAMRGNVVDMAVGIIIGAAFGAIVKSLVDDVLMPAIGLLMGNVDFANFFVVLKAGKAAGALRDAGGGQGGHGGDHELRPVHQLDRDLPHRGLCRVPAHQADQLVETEGRGAGCADDEGVPLLPVDGPPEGHPLPPVHLGAQGLRKYFGERV